MGLRGRFYPYLYILHILDCLGQDMQVFITLLLAPTNSDCPISINRREE